MKLEEIQEWANKFIKHINNGASECDVIQLLKDFNAFESAINIGDEFEIISNTSGHGFYIGEIVKLIDMNVDKGEYKFENDYDYWWCDITDVDKMD
jgi:hypothetical protein